MKLSLKNGLVGLACCALLGLAGCKKSSSSNYNVNVNVSGLLGSSLVLQLNASYNLPVVTNGVATFSTQLSNTTAYTVTVLKPPVGPSQSCSLTNASGVIASADVTNINLVCAPVELAYLTNSAADTVVPYYIDLGAGGLSNAGPATPTGNMPVAFAVSPSGRFAYALNQTDKTLSAYLANSFNGALLSAGAAVGTGTSSVPAVLPNAVAVDPSNQYVYITDGSANSISGFTINSSNAALTCIGNNAGTCPAAPLVSGLTGASALTITKSAPSEYLFATSADGHVYAYTIIAGGALSPSGSSATGAGPVAIAATPGTGAFVYVVNATDATVSGYANNSGVLSSTGAAVTTSGTSPAAIAINPAGTFAYVVNAGSNSIIAYSISASGQLTPVGTSVTGNMPVSVSVDPKGLYVYVADRLDGTVYVYTLAANGTTGVGVPQLLGNGPVSIVTLAN